MVRFRDYYSLFLRCKITMNLWYDKGKRPKIERFESFSADIYANLANRGGKIKVDRRISVIAPKGSTGCFITEICVRIGDI